MSKLYQIMPGDEDPGIVRWENVDTIPYPVRKYAPTQDMLDKEEVKRNTGWHYFKGWREFNARHFFFWYLGYADSIEKGKRVLVKPRVNQVGDIFSWAIDRMPAGFVFAGRRRAGRTLLCRWMIAIYDAFVLDKQVLILVGTYDDLDRTQYHLINHLARFSQDWPVKYYQDISNDSRHFVFKSGGMIRIMSVEQTKYSRAPLYRSGYKSISKDIYDSIIIDEYHKDMVGEAEEEFFDDCRHATDSLYVMMTANKRHDITLDELNGRCAHLNLGFVWVPSSFLVQMDEFGNSDLEKAAEKILERRNRFANLDNPDALKREKQRYPMLYEIIKPSNSEQQ